MRQVFWGLMIAAVASAGCTQDTPTRAVDSEDQMLAAVVAAVASDAHCGLESMLADLETAAVLDTPSAAASIRTASVSIGREGSELLWRLRRSSGTTESTTRFSVRPTAGRELRSIEVNSESDGVYEGGGVRLAGASVGRLTLIDIGDQRRLLTSGFLRVTGTPSFAWTSLRPFHESIVTLAWKRLSRTRGDRAASVLGEIDVTVAANGPNGMIVRSGTLSANGSGLARVSFGGRSFPFNLRRDVSR